jgi:hypothetical protein
MMKRIAILCAFAAAAVPALAHGADRGEAKATVAGKVVSIDYGRPSLKGRDMLAQAEVGKPWRMGADAATTLKTEAVLTFGSAAVPKGEYILTATRLDADQWQLNVLANTQERAKVVDIPLTSAKLKDSVETFTIELTGQKEQGELSMAWGTTALKAAFTGK